MLQTALKISQIFFTCMSTGIFKYYELNHYWFGLIRTALSTIIASDPAKISISRQEIVINAALASPGVDPANHDITTDIGTYL